MLIQTIAEQMNDVSHHVRLACQDLDITINANDEIPDEIWQANESAIKDNLSARQGVS